VSVPVTGPMKDRLGENEVRFRTADSPSPVEDAVGLHECRQSVFRRREGFLRLCVEVESVPALRAFMRLRSIAAVIVDSHCPLPEHEQVNARPRMHPINYNTSSAKLVGAVVQESLQDLDHWSD